MLPVEVGTYLAGAGLGLTLGTNLFMVPFPAGSPDACACFAEWGTEDALRAMGPSLGAPVAEQPRFKVMVRGSRDGAQAARTLAGNIHKKLDHLGEITLSGTRYLNIVAEQPQFLSFDDNDRPRYHFDCEVIKERSA